MDKRLYIKLESVDRVKDFVHAVSALDSDIDLVSGRYIIDAKSIMGIFSMNLSQRIECVIHAVNQDACEKAEAAIKPFIV